MSKSSAEDLFYDIIEEKQRAGDLVVTSRDDQGNPNGIVPTAQGQFKTELDLASNLQETVARYLSPENCN